MTTESFTRIESPTIIADTCTAVCINAEYFCLANVSTMSGSDIWIYSRATYNLGLQNEPVRKKLWLDDVVSAIILRGTIIVAKGSKRVVTIVSQ